MTARSVASRLVLVLLALLHAAAGAQPILQVEVRAGQVFMDVRDRSLADVLEALAQAGDFDLKLNHEFDEPVSLRLQGLPMERAVRRLLRRHSSVVLYAPGNGGRPRIKEIRVYRRNEGKPPARPAAARARPARNADAPADPARVAELAAILSGDTTTREQRQAITELRSMGGDVAVPALSVALELPDKSVRSYAVAVLGQIGSVQAVEILGAAAIGDEEPDVRIRAVIALARQHGEQAREFVEAVAARDAEDRVRQTADARLRAW
jgi:HEAT repeat protein